MNSWLRKREREVKTRPRAYFGMPSLMFGRVRDCLLFVLVACLTCLPLPNVRAAVEWQVIKIGGRDFLSVENIAKFYGFHEPLISGRTVHLAGDRGDLQFQLDSREMFVNGVRNWLSYPVFVHSGKVVVSRIDLAKTLEPQLRPNLIQSLGHVQTIVLDPGHGGFDKGAISSYGYEKDYTLDVARQLRPLLQAKGFRVIMTRESDVFVPLELRAQIANATSNSIFVSLHFNATDANAAATGFEIYSLTPRGAPSTHEDALTFAAISVQNGGPVDCASFELSTCVYHSLMGRLAEYDRGVKRARFAVLRLTKIPAVLIEGGFLSERGESRLIANSEWRRKLADAISSGIDSFRTVVETKRRPMLVADYQKQKSEPSPAPTPQGSPTATDLSVPPSLNPATASPAAGPLSPSSNTGSVEAHDPIEVAPSPGASNGPPEP